MRIVFMGTPQAAVPSLERLITDGHEIAAVYTQPDRPAGRGNKLKASAVKEFAVGKGLSVYQPLKMRAPETIDTFRAHNADVAVVVAYGRILPETLLRAFPSGAINVHFSLLPKYRGAAPVNWAIVNGESETGVTTMQMDAGLDTGDILLQRATRIDEDETSVEVMSRLSMIGAELLSETVASLGSLTPRQQDNAAATIAPIMKREDGRIDWSMSAAEIINRVRGFQPFPMAWTTFRDMHLTVWRGAPSDGEGGGSAPGTITEAKGDRLLVTCGDGTSLQITELQPEGKSRMAMRDFINGLRPTVGEILG